MALRENEPHSQLDTDPAINISANVNDAESPAKISYLLLLVSLFAGLTGVIALIMAYVYRGDSPAWLQSHFTFQIRTFWIGLLFALIGSVTAMIGIGVIILIATAIWLMIRSIKGFKVLNQRLPYPDPLSWWW